MLRHTPEGFPEVASAATFTIFLQSFLVDFPTVQCLLDLGHEIDSNQGASSGAILQLIYPAAQGGNVLLASLP